MSEVVWIHGDSISVTDPALKVHPEAPAIFVFDEVFLSSHRIAFHRLAFMYQGVRDVARARKAPVAVARGSMSEEILQFAREHQADTLHVTWAPTAEFKNTIDALQQHLQVVVYSPERLVRYEGEVRKFYPFWKKVQGQVLGDTPVEEHPE